MHESHEDDFTLAISDIEELRELSAEPSHRALDVRCKAGGRGALEAREEVRQTQRMHAECLSSSP